MEITLKNKTKYNRSMHNQVNAYTVISNKLINDNRLTIIEKGIMISILSNSDEYIFNSTYFKKQLGIGDDKFNTSMKKLINLGYIEKIKIQGGIQWVFNESPNDTNNTNKDDLSDSTKKTEQPINKEEIIEQNEPEEPIQAIVVEEEQEEVIPTVNIIEDKDEPEELIQVVEDGDEDDEDDEDDEEVIPTVKEIQPIQKKVIEEYVKPKEDRRPSLNGIDYAYASGPIDVDVLTRANEFFRDLSEINFEDKFVNIEKEFSKDQMLHLVFQINNIISGYNKEQVSGKLKELAFKK